MHDMDAERDAAVFGDLEPASAGRPRYGRRPYGRHVAPAEAGEQEFEAGRQIGEAPDVMADDAAAKVLRQRCGRSARAAHAAPAFRATDRARRGQRMVDGDDRHERDPRSGIRPRDRSAPAGVDRVDRKARRAVAQRCSAPPSASVKTDAGNCGKSTRSALRLAIRSGIGNIGVDRQRQFGLDVLGDALRRGANALARRRSARRASPDERRPASVRRGVLPERSNSGTPSDRLRASERLADRRLHPPEPSRGGRKTSGFRDRDEDAHLVERQGDSIIHHLQRWILT